MRAPTAFALIFVSCSLLGCEDYRADCANVRDPNRAIRACTAIISGGRDTKHNVAIALYNRGIAHSAKGNYDNGIRDLTASLALNPNYAKAHYNRALAHFSKGDAEAAITDYTEALRLRPKDSLAYSRRAAAILEKGQYDSAVADATEAIRLNPQDDFAYATRAAAYYFTGHYDRAITDFTVAIRMTPRDAKRYVARGWAHYRKLSMAAAFADGPGIVVSAGTGSVRALSSCRKGRALS
jgi:tetratricopeptide (TPR) repeat protein